MAGWRRALRGCEGATSAEYLGAVVVVAALVGALVTTPIGASVASGITAGICRISGGGCTAGAAGGGAADPGGTGDRRDTQREARGDRRDDARGDRGGQTQPKPPGTPGAKPALGVGDPVPGTSLPIPDPPAWQPSDQGAGPHGSQSPGIKDRATDAAAEAAANALAGTWPHASRNLLHFLGNSGDPLQQDVDAMRKDVPQFATAADATRDFAVRLALAKAQASGATGPVTVPISTPWNGFYIDKAMSADWFYALAGIQYSVVGTVTAYPPDTPGGPWRYEATTRTVIRDQYNWDGGKSTDIGPINITDEQLAELHRKGLAQEFTATGESTATTTKGSVP